MNDSFLEDLELVPTSKRTVKTHQAGRHVTTRNATSTPEQQFGNSDILENFILEKKIEYSTIESDASDTKHTNKRSSTKDTRKHSDPKRQVSKSKVSEKKEKVEIKLKPVENKVKSSENKERESKEDLRSKQQEARVKILENKVIKDRNRCSGSYKENNRSPDVSSKENSRPSESSKESTSLKVTKEKTMPDVSRKSEPKDKDPVALLNAIKDLISTYTKQESTKILRAMQELHINSQANLIKNLLFQRDDLIKEICPNTDSARLRAILEENQKLREDVVILQVRNEHLEKKLEELEFLKQENVALKLKCKELSKH